jgi:hypothetical protein
MRLEDLGTRERGRVEDSLKTARRVAAAYKKKRGSLKGLMAYLIKEHIPMVSLHVDVDEEAESVVWSGLANWPENWREMEKFRGAWFNVPEPSVEEVWAELNEYQRRYFAKMNPGRYLAAGIDISPYLSQEDLRKLQLESELD